MRITFLITMIAILGAFAITALIPQSVYATVAITSASWNDVSLSEMDAVIPREDMPLEFVFQSKDENNTDLATNFQCEVYLVNDDADINNNNTIVHGLDLDHDGTLDVARSDLTTVFSDICGTNTASSQISYKGLNPGYYVFAVAATKPTLGEPINQATFSFNVPSYQVSESSEAADTYNPRTDPSSHTFREFKQENATFANFEKVLDEKMLISNISALACFKGDYYQNAPLYEVPCGQILVFLSQEDISSVPSNSSVSSLFLNASMKSSSVYDALKYGINDYHFVCLEHDGDSISKYYYGCKEISIAYKNN